jgi:hypothetical protein
VPLLILLFVVVVDDTTTTALQTAPYRATRLAIGLVVVLAAEHVRSIPYGTTTSVNYLSHTSDRNISSDMS